MSQPDQPEYRPENRDREPAPGRDEPDTVPLPVASAEPEPAPWTAPASAGAAPPPRREPFIEESSRPVGEPDPPPARPEPKRRRPLPVPPPLNLGRRLRALAGVDERLMAYVPQEKTWYTSLGGVVLGTATIAAFSMWFAITEALGVTSGWSIIAVLVWFFFILSVDRWLVSGRLTGDLKKRIPVLLMRVA